MLNKTPCSCTVFVGTSHYSAIKLRRRGMWPSKQVSKAKTTATFQRAAFLPQTIWRHLQLDQPEQRMVTKQARKKNYSVSFHGTAPCLSIIVSVLGQFNSQTPRCEVPASANAAETSTYHTTPQHACSGHRGAYNVKKGSSVARILHSQCCPGLVNAFECFFPELSSNAYGVVLAFSSRQIVHTQKSRKHLSGRQLAVQLQGVLGRPSSPHTVGLSPHTGQTARTRSNMYCAVNFLIPCASPVKGQAEPSTSMMQRADCKGRYPSKYLEKRCLRNSQVVFCNGH